MRKFTKEISALLAATAMGASVCVATAAETSEQPIQMAGQAKISDQEVQPSTIIERTAGVATISDEEYFPPEDGVAMADPVDLTEPTEATTLPPVDGGLMPPDETEPTEDIPPLVGEPTLPDEEIPPLAGDIIEPPIEKSDFPYDIIDGKITITGFTGHTSGTITIPAKINGTEVEEIGDKAFFTILGSDSTVVVSEGIKRIGESAFTGFIGMGMNAIYLPKSIESIGMHSIGYSYLPPEVCSNYYDENYRHYTIKIYGYSGTVAEEYAKENRFKFIALDEEIPTEETTSPVPS